jgi:hypothetical protein
MDPSVRESRRSPEPPSWFVSKRQPVEAGCAGVSWQGLEPVGGAERKPDREVEVLA